jgi:SHS2 domain-containing protein
MSKISIFLICSIFYQDFRITFSEHISILWEDVDSRQLSYRLLDHATDAIVEIEARNLHDAFLATSSAVINLTLEQDKVENLKQIDFSAHGKDLRYLLFSWIEEIIFVLITEGFAINKIELEIQKTDGYNIKARAFGEPLDFKKHNFKVEIKAPTFHEMVITKNGHIYMRFLLDL